ncbi:LysR family transcriptional regulator [Cupriavidus sp. YAF13]|uniref:LysR family transcriptional regulator n=1 Tax=Cupriavidus sp. YAF13 TaxID=3233075 RepID=UPI003F8DA848
MTDLRQFQQFVAVAELLSFRRAAEALHMSQPPLTVAIKKLEETIGTELLERNRHMVRLTPAGEVFLVEARRTIAQAEIAVESARRAASGMFGTLRLSFVPSAALDVLPDILRRFQQEYPAVKLILTGESSGKQLELLRRGDTDVAIVVPPVYEPRDLSLDILCEETLVVAVPAAHALARRKRLRLEELKAEAFVAFPFAEGPGYSGVILAACQRAGFFPRVVQEASQMQTIITLVAGNLGIAIVPRAMTRVQALGVVYIDVTESRTSLRYPLVMASLTNTENALVGAFGAVAKRSLAGECSLHAPMAT